MRYALAGCILLIVIVLVTVVSASGASHSPLLAASGIGLIAGIWTVSTCAVLLAGAAVIGQADTLIAATERASDSLTGNILYALLRAAAVAILLLLIAFGFCFKIAVLKPIGFLIIIALVVLAALGAAVSARRIGQSLFALAKQQSTSLQEIPIGLAVLTVAAIMPVVGWIACGLILLAGSGAVIEPWLRPSSWRRL